MNVLVSPQQPQASQLTQNQLSDELLDLARRLYFHPHLIGPMVGYTKLTELHSRWIRYIWCPDEVPDVNGEMNNHRSLQGHRGSFKTTAITEIGTIWWLLFHPDDRVAIIRKTFTDSSKILFAIRQHFRNDKILELFGHLHGFPPRFIREKDDEVLMNFKKRVTKEVSITAHGIDGSITGNHYDKIIGDDLVTIKDRLSGAERVRTKLFISELLTNIIDPGKKAGIIGTPWHKDDAWSMPEMPPTDKWNTERAGILTEEEKADKRKTITPLLYAINYDLKFIADADAIFSEPNYSNWNWRGTVNVYAHIDAKYSGNHTGALTVMSMKDDQRIQARGWVFYDDFAEDAQLRNIVKALAQFRVRVVYLETNADKGFGGKELRRVINDMHERGEIKTVPTVREYHESMNKDLKIQTYLLKYWKRLDWDVRTASDYLAQITDYRDRQEPNDAPDSASSLLREQFFTGDAGSNKALWSKDAWGMNSRARRR